MPRHDFVTDIQAQAQPVYMGSIARPDPVKAVKNIGLLLFVNPNPAILDPDYHFFSLPLQIFAPAQFQTHCYGRFFGTVLKGVTD
jgi:hypothetical protein